MASRRLAELTYVEVGKLLSEGIDTVIFPIGTIEPHGPHLPLGTDNYIPELIAEKLAVKINALILPTLNYGVTNSLHGYPGSIRVRPESLENIVYDVLESIAFHGIRIALILNGHGGNTLALDNAARRAWLDHRLATLLIDWWTLARDRGLTKKYLGKEGGHAATDETALIELFRPNIVKKSQYSSDAIFTASAGVRAYPLPGTIINYSETEGEVVFSPEKAEEYLEALVEEIRQIYLKLRQTLSLVDIPSRKA
ncbi:MAG: creatininase family protein [Infirmifilum sp.]|uniref:Creatininase n=1 Tax=Infirmifilum uzonense TaxID=1550241 RepID=A0A0F7FGS5_9CREN|nr:creatininase family protein [Infirmifilum uzonense]AKG38285.1 hypothetical protein MA03_01910 [Infirmifilum uzonense]